MLLTNNDDCARFFDGKKIGILFCNKDARTFLRYYKAGIKHVDFSITCVMDPSLDFRPGVKARFVEIFGAESVLSDVDQIRSALQDRCFDVLLSFERNWESYNYPRVVNDWDELGKSMISDRIACASFGSYPEYNFRMHAAAVDFITTSALRNNIYVLNAYGENVRPNDIHEFRQNSLDADLLVDIKPFMSVMETYPEKFCDADVNIIFGSDKAVGKGSFLFNRVKMGSTGIGGDYWYSLVSGDALPPIGILRRHFSRGIIMTKIFEAWQRDSSKPIYINFGGRLEEYVYGFPVDRTDIFTKFPLFFRNVRFVLVIKASQTVESIGKVFGDMKKEYGIQRNLDVYRMDWDGNESKVNV